MYSEQLHNSTFLPNIRPVGLIRIKWFKWADICPILVTRNTEMYILKMKRSK